MEPIKFDGANVVYGAKKPEQAPAPEPEYRPTGDYQPMANDDMPF